MIAGGIGMALFDLMSGWTLWAPFTLVIVGCMGLVVGAIAEKHQTFPFYLLALVAACAIKIVGYYFAEAIIYGNLIVPITSIPGNLIQVGVAAVITLVIIHPLRLAVEHTGSANNCSISSILRPLFPGKPCNFGVFLQPAVFRLSFEPVERICRMALISTDFFKIIVAFTGATWYTFTCIERTRKIRFFSSASTLVFSPGVAR